MSIVVCVLAGIGALFLACISYGCLWIAYHYYSDAINAVAYKRDKAAMRAHDDAFRKSGYVWRTMSERIAMQAELTASQREFIEARKAAVQ